MIETEYDSIFRTFLSEMRIITIHSNSYTQQLFHSQGNHSIGFSTYDQTPQPWPYNNSLAIRQ